VIGVRILRAPAIEPLSPWPTPADLPSQRARPRLIYSVGVRTAQGMAAVRAGRRWELMPDGKCQRFRRVRSSAGQRLKCQVADAMYAARM